MHSARLRFVVSVAYNGSFSMCEPGGQYPHPPPEVSNWFDGHGSTVSSTTGADAGGDGDGSAAGGDGSAAGGDGSAAGGDGGDGGGAATGGEPA